MDMEQDKWIKQLHDKLAEHETAAPDNLWNDIETALNQQRRHTRVVAMRRWTAAAAAVAAILVVTFMGSGLFFSNDMEMSYADQETDLAASPEEELQDEAIETIQQVKPVGKTSQLALLTLPTKQSIVSQVPQESPSADAPTEQLDEPMPDSSSEQTEQTTSSSDEIKVSSHHVRPDIKTKPQTVKPQRTKFNPSFSLYAMNSFGEHDNRNGVFMADALARKYTNAFSEDNVAAASRQSTIFLTDYEEHQHHWQPIAFGLSVAYPLNHRLSLTSGIVYTRLKSDFSQTIHSQHIEQKQTLHYVGIPLGLSYRIWKYGSFRVYTAAGMQADWNVSAQRSTEGVEQKVGRDRLQWSLSGSLGLQYDVLPYLSVYAEPGINHHFDNGSSVQNYFKDKPTNLKLQLGVRLNLRTSHLVPRTSNHDY